MSDDYAGLKQSISDFLNAAATDKAINHLNEDGAQLLRQLTLLFRQKCTAQGITV
jgi:hypothetical protein